MQNQSLFYIRINLLNIINVHCSLFNQKFHKQQKQQVNCFFLLFLIILSTPFFTVIVLRLPIFFYTDRHFSICFSGKY